LNPTVNPQARFEADLKRATAGITYTPNQIQGLTNIAQQMGASQGALDLIANAPQATPTPPPTPRDTSPSKVYDVSDYSRVAPALNSAQLGALGERRRIAQQEYDQTLANVARNEALYQSDAERKRQNDQELSTRYIQDSVRDLAGKGVARSPMFAGRMIRAADQDLQMKWGETDSRLGIEMAALKSLVDNALSKKQTELALIEQDKASMRANLDAIFAASSMYGGM
jgi:hypothetical protein